MPSTGLVFKSRMGINVRVETRWSFTGLNNIIYITDGGGGGCEEERERELYRNQKISGAESCCRDGGGRAGDRGGEQ